MALSGASGATQLHDFIARVHQGSGSDADKVRELERIDAKQVQAQYDAIITWFERRPSARLQRQETQKKPRPSR